jgi:predicted transcriptional regulator
MSDNNENMLELTASIVSAYVGQNSVPSSDLGALIASTYAALAKLGSVPEATAAAPLVPAVSIRKSVTPDAIICLEDGKPFKSLKRHISAKFDLTPDQYRAKWGLPHDYPMVAPNYAEKRSALARSLGLGRKPAPAPAKAKRGRTAKAR